MLIQISDGKGNVNKQKVVVACGQHAREWISPATCMYIMENVSNFFWMRLKKSGSSVNIQKIACNIIG